MSALKDWINSERAKARVIVKADTRVFVGKKACIVKAGTKGLLSRIGDGVFYVRIGNMFRDSVAMGADEVEVIK